MEQKDRTENPASEPTTPRHDDLFRQPITDFALTAPEKTPGSGMFPAPLTRHRPVELKSRVQPSNDRFPPAVYVGFLRREPSQQIVLPDDHCALRL
jgi:hypothetical protein